MLRLWKISLFFFIWTIFLSSKLPNLSQSDLQVKINEVLKSHVQYKDITADLTDRILQNFLEELDPLKVYLIENEILEWTSPSQETKQQILASFRTGNIAIFEKIHEVMIKAIERRCDMEKTLKSLPETKGIDTQELVKQGWSKTPEELSLRLQKIKALQLETADKISKDHNNNQFIQLVEKRKKSRENEIIGETPEEKKAFIISAIIKATCTALDAHTAYFTPQEATQFIIHVQQSLIGIGVQLQDNLNGFRITRLIENGPAEKSKKLKINDLIIAVNQEPVVGYDIEDAVDKIRGEKNKPVLLTILRENSLTKEKEKMDIEIIREEVVLEEGRMQSSLESFGDGVIAHLRLFSFYQDPKTSSAHDLRKTLEKIQKENHLKGVILDLRNNGGGHLGQAVEVAGLFISKGIVVSMKDCTGLIKHIRNTDGKVVWDGPLVVLTNKASVSASEIVAQALQDYGRALIIGDKSTYGKGSFQTFTYDQASFLQPETKINEKGEFKVTRGMYYTVSGKTPQLTGVLADITVPGILSEMEIGEKYAKYPLKNDTIEPRYDDALEDIPSEHRKRISLLYKHNMQQKITTYTQYLEILRKNSEKRLSQNKNYQKFLQAIKNKKFDAEEVEIFGQSDMQLLECFNIMKDLIFFIEISDKFASSF